MAAELMWPLKDNKQMVFGPRARGQMQSPDSCHVGLALIFG